MHGITWHKLYSLSTETQFNNILKSSLSYSGANLCNPLPTAEIHQHTIHLNLGGRIHKNQTTCLKYYVEQLACEYCIYIYTCIICKYTYHTKNITSIVDGGSF